MSKEILFKFFEGKVTPEEVENVKKWVEGNPSNQRIFLEQRKLFDSLILLAREETVQHKKTFFFYPFIKTLGKVVSILLIVTAGLTIWQNNGKEIEEELLLQKIYVPSGQRINLTLPDGTNVWLNGNTTLSYPSNLGNKERIVFLEGEAFFNVLSKDKQPFIVKTELACIEVLGTQFNVESNKKNETFETTLIKGSVRISLNDESDNSIYLSPSQKAVLKDGKFETYFIHDFDPYRWKEGLISFNNKSLEDIMTILGKHYEKKIVIRNAKLLKYSYSGKFRLDDGLDYALQILQKDLKFEYIRDKETKEIIIR